MKTNQTQNKTEYVEAWNAYIGGMYRLAFTPSEELSFEVKAALDQLKELVIKVADDKGLEE